MSIKCVSQRICERFSRGGCFFGSASGDGGGAGVAPGFGGAGPSSSELYGRKAALGSMGSMPSMDGPRGGSGFTGCAAAGDWGGGRGGRRVKGLGPGAGLAPARAEAQDGVRKVKKRCFAAVRKIGGDAP